MEPPVPFHPAVRESTRIMSHLKWERPPSLLTCFWDLKEAPKLVKVYFFHVRLLENWNMKIRWNKIGKFQQFCYWNFHLIAYGHKLSNGWNNSLLILYILQMLNNYLRNWKSYISLQRSSVAHEVRTTRSLMANWHEKLLYLLCSSVAGRNE